MERKDKRVPHDNCGVNVDSEARYLVKRWLHKEDEGVGEGLPTNACDGVHVVIVAMSWAFGY